eukprot:CAMPEP_0178421234 /NCGR_PEP_ID=MMETSP0689_2-20121128/26543_1 /TAXON_ID=160604 /ORGANISM="Amphidinium massartii, Strain CS-259" /LENGTH=180 /DNA_ID=CAMNT_0020042741 /DNA_START=144 /DNA_END=689 /DNA_ORIENTATION=+
MILRRQRQDSLYLGFCFAIRLAFARSRRNLGIALSTQFGTAALPAMHHRKSTIHQIGNSSVACAIKSKLHPMDMRLWSQQLSSSVQAATDIARITKASTPWRMQMNMFLRISHRKAFRDGKGSRNIPAQPQKASRARVPKTTRETIQASLSQSAAKTSLKTRPTAKAKEATTSPKDASHV